MARLPVVTVTLLGAALRFVTLDQQSYWYDEALTVSILQLPFASMLEEVVDTQAQPPPYFVLAWGWVRIFGDSEVGLRSLSALLGTLTIPAAWAAARAVAGARVGLAVALLTALSPALIWYSQEARGYALVTLLATATLPWFLAALERPVARNLAPWAVASVLAVASHYFALFLVAPQAAWLLWRVRRPAVPYAIGLVAGLTALVPLLLYQREHGGAAWIAGLPLGDRLTDAVMFFVGGHEMPSPIEGRRALVVGVAVGTLAAAVLAGALLARARVRERFGLMLALGAAVIIGPMLAALAGSDFLLHRNFLPAWVPLTIAAVVGLSVQRVRTVGIPVVLLTAGLFAGISLWVPSSPRAKRDDWRAVAQRLGPAPADRIIAVAPGWQGRTLQVYRPGLRHSPEPRPVATVFTITYDGRVPYAQPVAVPAPGTPFRREGSERVDLMTITKYTAPKPVMLGAGALATRGNNGAAPFFEPAR